MVDGRLRRIDHVWRQRPWVGMIGTRLDQQHRPAGVLAESGGQNTTGGTSADDHDVILHLWTVPPAQGEPPLGTDVDQSYRRLQVGRAPSRFVRPMSYRRLLVTVNARS